MGLRLHPDKTRLTTFEDGFRYLGTLFSGDLTLPCVPKKTRRLDGTAAVVFVSGYLSAPRLPASDRRAAPEPPVARGVSAVASAASLTRTLNPHAPLLGAFDAALRAHERQTRRAVRHEAAIPCEASYLV